MKVGIRAGPGGTIDTTTLLIIIIVLIVPVAAGTAGEAGSRLIERYLTWALGGLAEAANALSRDTLHICPPFSIFDKAMSALEVEARTN